MTISLYDQSGKLYAQGSKALAPHGELLVGISDFSSSMNSSNLNAVVTSRPAQPVGATIYATNSGGRSFTYNAISAGDTSITSPLVYNGVNGSTTALTVQNTTATTAHVTIAYRDTSGTVRYAKSDIGGPCKCFTMCRERWPIFRFHRFCSDHFGSESHSGFVAQR